MGVDYRGFVATTPDPSCGPAAARPPLQTHEDPRSHRPATLLSDSKVTLDVVAGAAQDYYSM